MAHLNKDEMFLKNSQVVQIIKSQQKDTENKKKKQLVKYIYNLILCY